MIMMFWNFTSFFNETGTNPKVFFHYFTPYFHWIMGISTKQWDFFCQFDIVIVYKHIYSVFTHNLYSYYSTFQDWKSQLRFYCPQQSRITCDPPQQSSWLLWSWTPDLRTWPARSCRRPRRSRCRPNRWAKPPPTCVEAAGEKHDDKTGENPPPGHKLLLLHTLNFIFIFLMRVSSCVCVCCRRTCLFPPYIAPSAVCLLQHCLIKRFNDLWLRQLFKTAQWGLSNPWCAALNI